MQHAANNKVLQIPIPIPGSVNSKELETLYKNHEVKEELVIGPTEILNSHGQAIVYDTPKEQPTSPTKLFCEECSQIFTLNVAQCAQEKISQNKVEGEERQRNVQTINKTNKCEVNLDDRGPFPCNICRKTFTLQHNLKRHNNLYHRQKLLPYVCKDCGKEFVRTDYLSRHTKVCSKAVLRENKNKSTNAKSDECVCGKILKDSSNMRRHKRKYCEILAPKVFIRNQFFLECHKKVAGISNSKIYTCDYCKKSYSEKRNLIEHIGRYHLSLTRHKCEMCDKHFGTKRNLNKHKLIHRSKSYSCSFCNKILRSKWGHRLHEKKCKE